MQGLKKWLLVSLAMQVSGSAVAAPLSPTPDEVRLRPQWQALDANHDGKVTLDEVNPILAASLKKSDLDNDGAITLDEYVGFDLDPVGAGRVPLADNVRLLSDLPYANTNDPRQRVDVYLPKRATVAGPLPVIAYVHGGGWSVGSKIMARPQVMELVNSGRYAAVSIGYRLDWQDKWPAQIYDVKAAIRWIRANAKSYGFDGKRICAMGDSAGGHLVAQLGVTNGEAPSEGNLGKNLRQTSRVQCVIDMFGPVDLPNMALKSIVESLLGGTMSAKADVARDASPISHIDAKDPPFLIIHGTKDPLVPYQQSVAFEAALSKAGVPVLFQTVEGGGHGQFGAASPEVARRIRAFLERNFYDPSTEVPTEVLHK
ncbi:alpha/beta hydrolase fold domain-containing protein [Novosphingobium sp. G106]|uniref:alpha/beta hydrolase fold domain-containing protein n=1 Tax=Novosphingobium sp. G106 TaxID=2849500 RepID=UPI001C2D315D|nr:alpha/beta hydrolase fold domain-containing protein [Novosphingobium sp. G106]MBV1688757.1 alpha/beta hydrolase fold domain-containing protein [Novosphingobium sp. G106]